jgi:hypothetical protein
MRPTALRARTIRSRVALLLAIVSATAFGATSVGVRAAVVPADDPSYIMQLGDGYGASRPIDGLAQQGLAQVLFDARRFAYTLNGTTYQRSGFTKFVGWGFVPASNPNGSFPSSQLAMFNGADDGLHWDAPRPATIRDTQTQQDVPFTFDPNSAFAIYYDPTNVSTVSTSQAPFVIYYVVGAAPVFGIGSIHRAQSLDGVQWINDAAITQTGTSVIGAPNTFSSSSYGPSQVVFQPNASGTCGAGSPWNCKYVMIYDATGPTDATPASYKGRAALAFSSNGTTFTGLSAALIDGGAPGTWDAGTASFAHVVRQNDKFVLYYLGGTDGPQNTCRNQGSACFSAGSTTSNDGTHFDLTRQMISPAWLFGPFTGHGPDTLWNFVPVQVTDVKPHVQFYSNVITNKDETSEWLATSTSTPAQGPTMVMTDPAQHITQSEPGVEVFITDTLGPDPSKIGVDWSSIKMVLDPAANDHAIPPVTGTNINFDLPFPSVVGSLGQPARELFIAHLKKNGEPLIDGEHTLIVYARDLGGCVDAAGHAVGCATQIAEVFTISTKAPQTVLHSTPSSPALGFPSSIGQVTGDTTSAQPLQRVDVTITNPLGITQTNSTSDPTGMPARAIDPKHWQWAWIAHSPDPFYAIPGTYKITFSGVDQFGKSEPMIPCTTAPTPCNSFNMTVL